MQVDEQVETLRERCPWRQHGKLLTLPPYLRVFLLAVPELYPFYNKLVTVSKMVF